MRVVLCCLLLVLTSAFAQESPPPTTSPSSPPPSPSSSPSGTPARKVGLRFALPPLEGTISLGIFDHAGKLIRVLHREDSISDFTVGTDALETSWDGMDDDGN